MIAKFSAKCRIAGLAAVVLGAVAATAPASAQDMPTPYANGVMRFQDIINRTSPEEVAQVFVDAWRRGDFSLAFHMLSYDAILEMQNELHKEYSLRSFLSKYGAKTAKDMREWDENLNKNNKKLILDSYLYFEQNFVLAKMFNVLPFSFGPKVTFAPPRMEGNDKAVIDVTTDGRPDRMTVTLIRKETGDFWKIDEISFAGSVPGKKPWGFAHAKDEDSDE